MWDLREWLGCPDAATQQGYIRRVCWCRDHAVASSSDHLHHVERMAGNYHYGTGQHWSPESSQAEGVWTLADGHLGGRTVKNHWPAQTRDICSKTHEVGLNVTKRVAKLQTDDWVLGFVNQRLKPQFTRCLQAESLRYDSSKVQISAVIVIETVRCKSWFSRDGDRAHDVWASEPPSPRPSLAIQFIQVLSEPFAYICAMMIRTDPS